MKKYRPSLCLFLIVICAIFYITCNLFIEKPSSKRSAVSKFLHSLPEDEYNSLDCFFRYLVLKYPSAYVLFGEKPVAFSGFFLPKECKTLQEIESSNIKIMSGYKTWENHKKRLHLKNYLILSRIDEEYIDITIINKSHFLKTIKDHLEDFKQILGENITGELLLQQIEEHGGIDETVLKNHDGLLGVLLGFGKTNSWLFQRRKEMQELQNKFSLAPRKAHFFKEEEERINARLHFFGDQSTSLFSYLRLPAFLADPNDPETKYLKKKYCEDRKKIVKIYSNGKFLETTLQQFCSE